MASLEGLKTRAILTKGVVVSNGADTPIQIRLKYVGAVSVTSVTVTTGTNIVTVTTEASGTVTKTYTFATYTTVGALADQINSDGLFEAKVLDALRSDATTGGNYQIDGAITSGTDSNGNTVWDMLTDTSVFKAVTATITYSRAIGTGILGRSHRVHLQEISYFGTLGGAGANLVRVYIRRGTGVGAGANTETQVYGDTSVSATATKINWDLGMAKISGGDGDSIIVRLQDGTSLSDTALVLRAIGQVE